MGGEFATDKEQLINALRNNAILCIPHGHDFERGYEIASYRLRDPESPDSFFDIRLEYKGVEYIVSGCDGNYLICDYPKAIATNVVILYPETDDFQISDVQADTVYIIEIEEGLSNLILGCYDEIYKPATIRFFSKQRVSGSSEGTTISIFASGEVLWANGVIPEIEINVWYELSLATNSAGNVLAVLTPFKPAE